MKTRQKNVSLPLAALVLCMTLEACGKVDRGDLPEVYPVRGMILRDGKHVAGATVSFQRTDGTRGAIGETDEQGLYQLTTFHQNDGAVPGEYQIAIYQFSKQPRDYPVRQSEDDKNYVEFVPVNLLPQKFSKPEASGLKAVVNPEKNVIDLDLK